MAVKVWSVGGGRWMSLAVEEADWAIGVRVRGELAIEPPPNNGLDPSTRLLICRTSPGLLGIWTIVGLEMTLALTGFSAAMPVARILVRAVWALDVL